jgi:hypothetical protein
MRWIVDMTLTFADVTHFLGCFMRQVTSMTLRFTHVTLHFVDLKR